MTAAIVTVTLNPAIDMSGEAEQVRATHKTRLCDERVEAGGGGINVARTLDEFGVPVRAIYLSGGATGRALDEMLGRCGIQRDRVEIRGDTRLSLTVHEHSTGLEYRFVPEGPNVREEEWRKALEKAGSADCDYLVASGSLPNGVPDDFYALLGAKLKARKIRYVLDTSGPELHQALDEGGIYLLKPSREELEKLAGKSLDEDGLARTAAALIDQGKVALVAVTMGRDGALLVGEDFRFRLAAVAVETRSALGAGDSFVGAMTYALATGTDVKEAFRLGVAAGAAAAMTVGARLCRAEDARQLLDLVPKL